MPAAVANRIRAVIVDDEPLARANLVVLLGRDESVQIVGECGSAAEAVTLIRAVRPDLVFLDIAMPQHDGFDVLESLGPNVPPAVVFVTAFERHAVRAFEAGALDYLLKPFDDKRFARALARAKERIAENRSGAAIHASFAVKTAGHVVLVNVGDIEWIGAADYYSRLHTASGSHLLRRSLNDIAAELDPTAFCRIHRSAIVKLDGIRSLEINEMGEYDVVLDRGARLPLSRRYRKHLQSQLPLHP